MPFEIPLTSDTSQKLEVELEGIRYFLSVQYNFQGKIWLMKIEDEGSVLVESLPLKIGRDLLKFYVDVSRTLGQFWVLDTRETDEDAGSDNLGSDVKLIYYPLGEEPILPDIEVEPIEFEV